MPLHFLHSFNTRVRTSSLFCTPDRFPSPPTTPTTTTATDGDGWPLGRPAQGRGPSLRRPLRRRSRHRAAAAAPSQPPRRRRRAAARRLPGPARERDARRFPAGPRRRHEGRRRGRVLLRAIASSPLLVHAAFLPTTAPDGPRGCRPRRRRTAYEPQFRRPVGASARAATPGLRRVASRREHVRPLYYLLRLLFMRATPHYETNLQADPAPTTPSVCCARQAAILVPNP
jgi:hypothetical protein